MARPKKTIKDLPAEWESIAQDMYRKGASDTEVKVELGMSNDLFARFMDEHEEFSEAIKQGRLLSQAWWERHGRKNLDNKEFNSTLWYMNMKNRFGWSDKQEHEHSGKDGGPMEFTFSLDNANSDD